jgi:hypothetical protein
VQVRAGTKALYAMLLDWTHSCRFLFARYGGSGITTSECNTNDGDPAEIGSSEGGLSETVSLGSGVSLVGGVVLVSLRSGGCSSETTECNRLGGWNDGSIWLLSGVGLGWGASLESGSVSLTVLGSADSLVGGWLLSLGSGGSGIDSSECSRLGRPSLLKGSSDGPGLCGTSLEGPGPSDDPTGDVGGWLEVVEGTGLSKGDWTPEPSESSDVMESCDTLGTGDALGGCRDVPELPSL